MKKKWILVLCVGLLLSVAVLLYPREHGTVFAAVRIVGQSDVYTREDIEAAMDVAQTHFHKYFTGCTLFTLRYDADWWYPEEEWAKTYEMDQAIIVSSSFYVPPRGGHPSWNPNSLYTGWQWILARNDGETWTLKDFGYS